MSVIEHRQEMVKAIEYTRPQIVDGLVQEMYQDPFWEARYGERGRIHSVQDTHYHLNKLIDAISLDLPDVFTQYYHWVQGLLVYRGMSTLHLQETLDSLANQLSIHVREYWPQIQVYLKAGYEGIVYTNSDCQALVEKSMEIAQAATRRLLDPGNVHILPASRSEADWLRDNRFFLSYLADAVWVEKEELFGNQINWVKGFLAPFGITEKILQQDMRLLAEETRRALPGDQAARFVRLLREQAKT